MSGSGGGGSAPDVRARVQEAMLASRLSLDGGAYTVLLGEAALEAARPGGRPTGILERRTMAVKDMIAVRGQRQGGGSPIREDTEPCPSHAPVVATLLHAGAVLIGLAALHELAFGVTGINAYTGTPEHPAGEGLVPGGSSSGSAVAVATGSADLALGTDTGGSVRIPAALCGVVGYKPAYQRFSSIGVLPLAPSLDHVGVLASSVALAASVDGLLRPQGRAGPVRAVSTPLTLALVRGRLEGSEPAVAHAVMNALERLAERHAVVEIDLASNDEVIALTDTIMFREAAQFYGGYARDPQSGLGDDVRARLEAGMRITTAQYEDARQRAEVLVRVLRTRVASVDAVVEPTVPICAPRIEEAPALGGRLVSHTRLANLTGLPAISLPVPTLGLPVGLQLTGSDSRRLLACAAAVEGLLALAG